MEQRTFSLKALLKSLFCEHEYHYQCSCGCKDKISDYYKCKKCGKFITIVRPDFVTNALEEVKERIKK